MAAAAGVSPALAASRHVTNCDPSGPGSLSAVVSAATSGNTVVFDQDCTDASSIVLGAEILISGKTLTIDGSGHAITVSGNDAVRIFNVAASSALTLKNLTLNRGHTTDIDGGGAVLNNGGTLTVQGSNFGLATVSPSNTSGGNGGGAIANLSGTAIIRSSYFVNNLASSGVASGGAIRNTGVMTVDGSTLDGNVADTASGGAIVNNSPGVLTLRNSTVTDNGASAFGGGIFNSGGVTLENDTLTGNSANSGGGSIANVSGGTLGVANTIVSGGCFTPTPITDNGNNLQFGDATCGFALTGDPMLGPLQDNGGPTQTRALNEGSPAIGAGSASVCTSPGIGDRDQRGNVRRSAARGSCDIGAYDTGADPASAVKTTISRTPISIVADGSSTADITVTARDANGFRITQGGDTVELQTNLGDLSEVTDNGDGTYTATLTAGTVAGTAKITGAINTVALSATTVVTFLAGPVSTSTSTMTTSKMRISADGTSQALITVQAKDQYGNLLKTGGSIVALSPNIGSMGSVTYIGGGRYQGTLTSATTPGTATISGTIDSHPMTATATVVFTNPTVTSCNDSGPGSLRAVIAGAPSGATIVFAQSCTITLASQILVFGTTLTIDGVGRSVTISGGNTTRLFGNSGTLTLSRLTLANGHVGGGDVGGGISNSGTLTVRNSTFSGNNSGQGGAVFNQGTLTAESSTFAGNTADYGGGIKNNPGGAVTIGNSTFTGNSAGVSGALDNQVGGTFTVRNSTFAGNTASQGGLIYNQGDASFANTIASGNTGGQCDGPSGVSGVFNAGNNLQFGDATCGFSLYADPMLGSLAANGGPTQTMALGEGSPAIGAGSAATCQAVGNVDQRGISRRADALGRCDIGAYDTRGYVAGPLSAGATTITRSTKSIPADGTSSATITVKARDANGVPFKTGGATVTLGNTAGDLSGVTDNGDGTYTATLTSTTPGLATISGTINTQPITATTTVRFT